MMPTFPSPSLKFRTVSFPQYGFKVGLSDGAFLNRAQYHVAQFASVLRALRFHRRIPRTVPRDAARLSTSVRAAFAALPQGSSLRPGFCSPGHHRLIDPIRPTRRLAAISLPGRLYATSLLCRVIWPKLTTSGSRLSLPFPLDMPPSTTPGSSVPQWSSLATPTWAFALAERGSALPSSLQSASRRPEFSGLPGSLLLQPVKSLAPCADLSGSYPGHRGFYFQASGELVTRLAAGYNYDSPWTILSVGLAPTGMTSSLAALQPKLANKKRILVLTPSMRMPSMSRGSLRF
jgi:hypothetical protein